MWTSRVVSWCAVGCLLVSCGDSNKTVSSRNSVAGASGTSGTSGGKGGAGGGAGTSAGGASGSGAVATGGSAGAGAKGGTAGAAGAGGAGDPSGGTGGTVSAGDAGEAGSGSEVGGSAGATGAGGEGGAGLLGEGIEGIYTLDDAILNTSNCDPGGTNVRGAYEATHLVVRRTIANTTGGRPALVVTGCAGLAACRALGARLVDDATAFELIPYSLFVTEEPDGTFIGTTVFYGTLDATTCRNGGIDLLSLVVEDVSLTFETRSQRTDYPAVNGACTAGPAAEHGAMAPCTQLRVLTGTRVETF